MSETSESTVPNSPIIVIDNGSCSCKIGFNNSTIPKATFPCVIGTLCPIVKEAMLNSNFNNYTIGTEAQENRGILDINYPIKYGIMDNEKEMNKIFFHVFYNKLKCDPESTNVLISEHALSSKRNIDIICKCLFDEYNISGLCIASTAKLSFLSFACSTGVVVECGDSITSVTCFYDNKTIVNSIQRTTIAGRRITENLMKILYKRGYYLTGSDEKELAREIKEKLSYIALDYNEELDNIYVNKIEENYELPDGEIMTIGEERFMCTEGLFNPNIYGFKDDGIHKLIVKSIESCDNDIRNTLWGNIYICGGSTLIKGFKERLEKELRTIIPDDMNLCINPASSINSSYIGGCILASSKDFKDKLFTKEDYKNGNIIELLL